MGMIGVAWVLALVALLAPPAEAGVVPPNGSLNVAYRQLEQGQLSEFVHQLELQCWDARCSVTILSLNQCMQSSAGLAFYPKVQRSSTDDGDLKVIRVSPGLLEAEQKLEGTRFLYRFSYIEREDPGLRQRLGLRNSRFFERLSAFSGSAVKSSEVLGKVVSWDLVPLKGASAFVEARCKIMLDGVPE